MRGIALCVGIFALCSGIITLFMAEAQALGYLQQRKGGYYLIIAMVDMFMAIIGFTIFFW